MESLTVQLAEKITNIGVRNSYGTPIEVDGATIIPVALVSFGFGGGEGDTTNAENAGDSGSGGGGGGMSVPVGAYVTRNGATRFEPNPIALLAVCVPLVTATGFAAARMVKALKR